MPISPSTATVFQVISVVIIGSAVGKIPDIISNLISTASPNLSNCVEEHKNRFREGGFSAPRSPLRVEKKCSPDQDKEFMGNDGNPNVLSGANA